MLSVLIAGGGPAALEAALRLDRLAGDRVSTTLLAPDTEFTYRPLSVLDPFAAGGAWDYPLARLAADANFVHRLAALVSVDPERREVETDRGERIAYDALLVAVVREADPRLAGTRPRSPAWRPTPRRCTGSSRTSSSATRARSPLSSRPAPRGRCRSTRSR